MSYFELPEALRNARSGDGQLLFDFGMTLNYLFSIEALEQRFVRSLPVHQVRKCIPFIDDAGNLVKPEEPNAWKTEILITDMIPCFDDILAQEVVREVEFAPIKNATGDDSPEEARRLLRQNGYEL